MELGFGEKKENYMKRIQQNNQVFEGTFGKMVRVPDFLPPPEELILRPPAIKITINLDQKTLSFFKDEAEKLGGSYQRMIRNLLDHYVKSFQNMKRS